MVAKRGFILRKQKQILKERFGVVPLHEYAQKEGLGRSGKLKVVGHRPGQGKWAGLTVPMIQRGPRRHMQIEGGGRRRGKKKY